MARRSAAARTASPRDADLEAALLHEVAVFMDSTASTLEALLPAARALRRRLVGTATYQRVDGLDNGDDEPIWDLAGTLEVLLEEDVENVAAYMRRGATLAFRSWRAATRALSVARPRPQSEGQEPQPR